MGGTTKKARARELFEEGATVHEVVAATGLSLSNAYTLHREIKNEKKAASSWRLRRSVWMLFRDGLTPDEIDESLGIDNSREMLVAEWRFDQLRKPSMVTAVGRKIEPPED